MAKKEFLDKEPVIQDADLEAKTPSAFSQKLSELYNRAFSITKLIFGLSLLPLVFSSSFSLANELNAVGKPYNDYFWLGIMNLLILYLFIWEPAVIYSKGQKITEFMFRFIKPMVRVAPYLLPIYSIVLFLAYLLISLFVKSPWLAKYTVFFFGFTLTLHLVFGAKSLRSKKEDFIKANYIFGFSFVYILNLFLVAVFLSLILEKFSLVNFSNNSFQAAGDIFHRTFKQLFL